MAINIKDRIKQGTNTTGSGTVTLHVSYSTSGFQDFSVLGDNAQTYYAIEESPNKFEVGLGTYSGNTLSRDTIFSSSNSNNPVSLGGSGLVFVTYPAEKAVFSDSANVVSVTGVSLGATGIVFSDGTTQTTASSSAGSSYDFWTVTDGSNTSNISSSGNVKITGAGEVTVSVSSGSPNVVTVSGASADLSSYATTSNLAATGATNAAAIANNTSNISSNTSAIASTGATNASAISSNTSNISNNTSNIASTGATNAAAISSNTSNIASTGFTNASGISANTASISSNTSNIASTGATNASGITSNTSSISSNTSNIATTGATNASGITANTSNISSNTSNIGSTGSTLVSQIAATGATNAAAIASKDNYQYWTLKGDSSTTTNIDSTETVQITGAGNVSVSLGGSDDRIVTVSGADQDLSSYATTSYVGTVSGDLNTKINNNIYSWNATGVYGASSTGVTLSQGDSLTVSGASGVSVNLTAGTPNKFVVSHDDTSSAGSVTVTPNNFITSVKLDTYGHVTGLGYAEVTGVGSGAGGGGGSYSFTVSDGVSGEAVPSGGTVTWSGGGATTVSYNTGTNTFLVNTPSSESSYTQWIASDGANTSNVENNNQVRITGAGNTTVTLASGSPNVFTISGTDQDLSSYATVSNLASTGATNAAAAATNAGNISTNTSNIASTGATNASAAATNSSNISTNLSTINTIKASGLYIPTAGTGLQLVGNAINVSGIDSTMIVNGSVLNADLANSTVSYGGVTLSLGGSDATPAFNLSDATGYPTGVIATSIANTGATNAASAATNAGNISTNTSNIASTGATNAAAAATNAGNISTNTSNIASTGATNAAAAASNASNISTNTSNIASTGATNASAASTNAGNITTNLNSINTIKASGLYIPTAGTGLQLVGNEFNVSGIDSTMIVNGSVSNDDLAGSIANAKLANSSVTVTAGDALTGGGAVSLGGSVSLAVGVDDSSIEINSDAVRVKAGGVTAAMLNSDVTLDEITDHGATTTNNITVGTTTTSGILTPLISGSGSSSVTFDLSTASTFTHSIDQTTTLALSNVTAGQKFMIRLKQNSAGSKSVNWFSTIYWAEGGTAPTLTTAAYHSDVFGFLCTTSGYYEGFVIGQNISGA